MITVTNHNHGVEVGDWITTTTRDPRWTRRVMHWILRRPGYPVIRSRYRVESCTGTTLKTTHMEGR